jgi:hypothetical protein
MEQHARGCVGEPELVDDEQARLVFAVHMLTSLLFQTNCSIRRMPMGRRLSSKAETLKTVSGLERVMSVGRAKSAPSELSTQRARRVARLRTRR